MVNFGKLMAGNIPCLSNNPKQYPRLAINAKQCPFQDRESHEIRPLQTCLAERFVKDPYNDFA
jgi:hypothetical protein